MVGLFAGLFAYPLADDQHQQGNGPYHNGKAWKLIRPDEQAPSSNLIRLGLESIIAAVLIGAWTAFETLATDLWVEAVNQRPNKLGVKVAAAEIAGGNEWPKLTKSICLSEIQRHGFDLRQHMGDAMKYKFKFNGIRGIKSAYKATFPDDRAPCKPFDDEDLKAPHAIRNVLVHNGEVPDKDFIARTKNYAPLHYLTGLAGPLQEYLTGKTAAQMTTSAYRRSIELLHAVDDWLANNPERGRRDAP